MRKILNILVFAGLLFMQQGYAQRIGNLDGIYYQAVALDDNTQEIVGVDVEDKPLHNREIGVRFIISKGLDGEVQWEEEHVTTTDKYGLFTLIIGKGNVLSTAYSSLLEIPWIDADQFLKVEISTKNDGNYKMVSNQIFMAVPYAFYADDIADNAITTEKILNEEIIAEDIATDAVTSDEILDETILANDIATGAVGTSEIENESITVDDIGIDAVGSSEIITESVEKEDLAPNSVDTEKIVDESIFNVDIANGTIDIATKIANVKPQQILIGDTISIGAPKLKALVAGSGITIAQTSDSVFIASTLGSGGVESNGNLIANIGTVGSGALWGPSQTYNVTISNGQTAQVGDLVLASLNKQLDGCILSAWIHGIQGDKVQIKFSIFNPTGNDVVFGNGVDVKLLIVQ